MDWCDHVRFAPERILTGGTMPEEEVRESIMYKEIDKAILCGVVSGVFMTLAIVNKGIAGIIVFIIALIIYLIARYVGHRRLFFLMEEDEEEGEI